ncbi:ABC transporter substrate-binding protein [Vibrio ezurae]|uniref:Putative amino acid ABC transporter substrate-binding protein n=1 Tax=Vibrio ezurae NBRC 102218 TaxID=1219080 RepID=U3CDG2_9VIBR|nr:ABC transporter substrate-binding protein [Vibrio ezurae]GAD79304.1 putative amino acid ABC transporter substrate-binding protein [Vibrio ezurae NBRC 102218]
MKKWLLAATLAATALSGFAQAKDWKQIRFAVEGAYPPFNKTESDGTLSGFDVDIAHALCKEMEVKCVLVAQDWDGMIPSLLARKYDAIVSGMSITEERKKKIDFTNKYALVPNKFVAKKGAHLDFSKDGLKGVKIGVQRATTHDKYLTENYAGEVEVVRYGSFDEAYLDLANGRISAVLGDATALEEGVLNSADGDKYEFVGPTMTDPKWFGEGFGIATRKQDKDLTEMLNKAILAIRADGTYKKVQDKYFKFDVYGE